MLGDIISLMRKGLAVPSLLAARILASELGTIWLRWRGACPVWVTQTALAAARKRILIIVPPEATAFPGCDVAGVANVRGVAFRCCELGDVREGVHANTAGAPACPRVLSVVGCGLSQDYEHRRADWSVGATPVALLYWALYKFGLRLAARPSITGRRLLG